MKLTYSEQRMASSFVTKRSFSRRFVSTVSLRCILLILSRLVVDFFAFATSQLTDYFVFPGPNAILPESQTEVVVIEFALLSRAL